MGDTRGAAPRFCFLAYLGADVRRRVAKGDAHLTATLPTARVAGVGGR